jgi:hypothetical protein
MMDRQTKGFTAAILLAFAVLLQGCGYQPLYATRADGTSVSQDLASVSVQHQSTRVGQLVRNEIEDQHGQPARLHQTAMC